MLQSNYHDIISEIQFLSCSLSFCSLSYNFLCPLAFSDSPKITSLKSRKQNWMNYFNVSLTNAIYKWKIPWWLTHSFPLLLTLLLFIYPPKGMEQEGITLSISEQSPTNACAYWSEDLQRENKWFRNLRGNSLNWRVSWSQNCQSTSEILISISLSLSQAFLVVFSAHSLHFRCASLQLYARTKLWEISQIFS